MSDIIIGIDLGTTNSEVAVVQNGRPHIIEVDGAKILPSVVGLADDASLLVGKAARNQYVLYPERTIRSVKRRMGEDVSLDMGEQRYRPQEISALILQRLKRAAEDHLGEAVAKAVITVPAYFSDAQRQATRDAGQLAGLEVVRIINEPTAAALAYEADHTTAKTILVYDLGGGTFDVSVVRLSQDVTEVLASHGNNQLGGDDFDAKLVNHVVEHLKETKGIDPSEARTAMARIVRACETAKIALSDAPYARIEEEYLLEQDGSPVNLSLEIDREVYEDMISDYIDETLEAVHIALKGASLAVSDIDEVLLVGGATRTPLVQQRLEETLGMQPRSEVDPDLCVAAGAAIQAAVVAGEKVSAVLVDITPYTFGTSAMSILNGEPYPYTYVPLIRKNTPIPVTKTEAFETLYDGQQIIDIKVYQGEDPDALNNTEIGSFRIEGLRDVEAGNIILTTFSLDLNGILQVTAREKSTGLEQRITIDNATSRFESQELDAARERLSTLIEGEARDVTAEHRGSVQAKALIEKAERLMDTASAEDKEDLVDMTESLRDALEAGDTGAIEEAKSALSDLIYYLET
ncbi:Hsp70 family protein [Thiorhodococcus mannitoliphagus]|uniref:Hsp70 family protein n=1 Tax=Thiorhodococcus mannitoliphagus TaxID=329406 RepID=A0A6P1DY65_9GAMM|nr:Hsp70 family protein [Thiorhodococcus mannitoliphagus]NEX22420.1 Hsp70 family protein [Thiorhodococcus mannitoliphagus]